MTVRTRLLVAISLLAAGLGGKWVLAGCLASDDADSANLRAPLKQFPERIGSWVGTDVPANPKIISDIKIDDYLNRCYVHPSGEKLVLWMSYSGKSLDQYHYPTVCMEGAGWTEDETCREQLTLCPAAHGPKTSSRDVSAMSLLFTKDQAENTQVVYYWYYLIGESPVDRLMRHSSQWLRAFLRGRRNASLTIEVFSQSPNPDRRVLDAFAKDVASRLRSFLPASTEADCTLGATY